MTPERWKEVERLYQAALELQPSKRFQFLTECCPDGELRSEVESLLRHRNPDLFERPALDLAADLLTGQQTTVTGATIDHYEVLSLIDKGGMGEVFRARDTRLGRQVAIKISSSDFSKRFEREARAISALNHPHICTLYDVGPNYLVMELVEGETLAARLKKSALAIEQVLEYGAQIADALAAAHAKAIMHRDLKPGNIMISKTAGVKVLDFGLAKIRSQSGESLTESHVVMGTPAYMAPEQLEGGKADERSDIYSLGLVLYEMAAGKRAVQGHLSPMEQLPLSFAHVVERCLAPDPEKRWQSARDIQAELQWLSSPKDAKAKEKHKNWRPWAWAAAAVLVIVVAAAAMLVSTVAKTQTTAAHAFSFHIPIPSGLRMITRNSFSISPDGSTIAFLAARPDDIEHIWVQRVGELEARVLPGTESPPYSPPPIWSPDSRTIVYYAGGKLKKIEVTGGSPQTICDVSTYSSGGAWSAKDMILFGDLTRGIMRVPASGGTPARLTAINSGERLHGGPNFLPGGRHFLYYREGESADISGIYIGSVDAQPDQQDSKRLLATTTFAQVVAPKGGQTKVLFLRSQTLMAQEFDMARLRLVGEPVAVAAPVGNSLAVGFFAASTTTLAYRAPVEQRIQLQWFDRGGNKGKAVGEPQTRQSSVALSTGGQHALVSRADSETSDIWLLDLSREVSVRLTTGQALKYAPVWASDGKRFVFSSRTPLADLYQGSVDGEGRAELLFQSNVNKLGLSWSPDARFLLYAALTAATKNDLFILPIDKGKAGTPIPFAATEADESDARFSPDGRWIAYVSDETGAPEVYVRSFVPPADTNSANPQRVSSGPKIRLSLAGGTHPRWSGNSKEVFYSARNGDLMTVAVSGAGTFRVESSHLLFLMAPNSVWDVTPDGKRFLVGVPVEQNTQTPFTVVMNWPAGLKNP